MPVRLVTQMFTSLAVVVALVGGPRSVFAAELSVDDFDFNGILGSDGATLERLGPNHFKIHLAQAPGHPEWRNMCQFMIKQNAKGNTLRLDGVAGGIRQFCSWSYDRQTWHPIRPEQLKENGLEGNDDQNQAKALRALTSRPSPTHWCSGTHVQMQLSAFCVEGASDNLTKNGNKQTGALLIKSVSEFYGQMRAPMERHSAKKDRSSN